ncbi:MAG: hypothetical protein ABI675_10385 [Chitinophagaceae bacterium]
MNLFNIMGLVSTLALALPIIILLTSKLARYRSFPALFFYYLLVLNYSIARLGYIGTGSDYKYYHGVICNFLDTPLILLFLTYFSKTVYFRKKMQIVTFIFIAFEVVVMSIYGFNAKATTIILAPGLLLTLAISFIFFIHQVKIAVMHHKALGKAIMISSVLFAYVGYCFVYAVYYLIKPVYKDDAHIVYFLITIISSIIMTVGIHFERARVRQLAELRTTREELKAIYREEREAKKMTTPREAVILNFDKEQWS